MPKANIHRRHSLERIYPPDAFANDAAQNGRTIGEVVRGVCILSSPDAVGDFDLELATRQVGEVASPTFLAPSRTADHSEDLRVPDPSAGYQQFLDRVLAAAQRFGFTAEETPGRNDARIRGLRQ
jgi:hypothetical protein